MSEQQPRVVVACAWYNRADYIRDTVDSLLAQDFDNFEVVIVNDGSTDFRVKEILDSYSDSRLRVIHQENTGFVRAISRAIDSSDAPYIAIQGAGDVSLPDRLKRQYNYLSINCDVACVACKVDQVVYGGPNDGIHIAKKYPKMVYSHQDFLTTHALTQGETMYRRDAFYSAGGYREAFKYSQDTDLWLRMSKFGDFHIIDKVSYERRLFHADGVSTDSRKQLLQKALASFAKQCALEKDTTGTDDLVDLYGSVALVLRQSSKELARYAFKSSVKSIVNKDYNSAVFFLEFAKKEYPALKNILLCNMLGFFYKFNFSRQVIMYFMKILGKEDATLATRK